MKVNITRIDDGDLATPSLFARKLRESLDAIEKAFNKIRLDGVLIIGGGSKINKYLKGTTTWNPGSVSDGAQTTTTVSVTGAAMGDGVVVSFSNSLQAMQMTGYVSATDTVTVVLRNGTGAPIDLASGTLTVDVWQR